ncbi:serpin B8-like [Periophthalmus magnuspinnatus]|uniref:serpin B8-like n=1 Tax=Periophthalmus magnuspinnatus TaxID=409849 RepID=UPI0024372814|nr:serpin B8-like [Periophthalmus magnuspinnatus]
MGQAESCMDTPGAPLSAEADTGASDSLSKANISFTLDLFKTLGNQNKTSNVSFSPFSVSAALSMLLLGAKGSTANQMRECLKTKNCQDVHSSFAALLKELKNTDSLHVLSVANRLYGDQSCKFIKPNTCQREETVLFYYAHYHSHCRDNVVTVIKAPVHLAKLKHKTG